MAALAHPSGTAAGGAVTTAPEGTIFAFYPGSGEFDSMENNIINAPIPPLWRERKDRRDRQRAQSKATTGRFAVRRMVDERLVPALRSFGPDLILISAGFDAGAGDAGNIRLWGQYAAQGMNLLPEDFNWITHRILDVARVCCPGKVVSVLEGGYGIWREAKSEKDKDAPKEKGKGAKASTESDMVDATQTATASATASAAATTATGATGAAASVDANAASSASSSGERASSPVAPNLYLDRQNLVENCAAHLRALIDDAHARP